MCLYNYNYIYIYIYTSHVCDDSNAPANLKYEMLIVFNSCLVWKDLKVLQSACKYLTKDLTTSTNVLDPMPGTYVV